MKEPKDDRKAAFEESVRRREEGQRALVSRILGALRVWQSCENRACRRARRCCDLAACQQNYRDEIRCFFHKVILPGLRARYPTVQWGAPAGLVEEQYEAALAAEAERNAKRTGRRE